MEEEDLVTEGPEGGKNASFSEELSLFQSIQVLANEEEELAFKNKTAQSGKDYFWGV